MNPKAQQVISMCEQKLVGANINACNYFVRDVATALGLNDSGFLNTTATGQVLQLFANTDWTNLGRGNAGATAALVAVNEGKLVIAGWKPTGSGHGHVAIAVYGSPVNGWPLGYWGQYPSGPGGFGESLRESFGATKRPDTQFFAHEF